MAKTFTMGFAAKKDTNLAVEGDEEEQAEVAEDDEES